MNLLQVDLVIPVFNEAGILERNVLSLVHSLSGDVRVSWRIIIADNGSTDSTAQVAQRLVAWDQRINYMHTPTRGRGRTLKTCWLNSEADVVCYIDADLPFGLECIPLLLNEMAQGQDVVSGSRALDDSSFRSSFMREVLSTSYNLIIKGLFRNNFSDAQCGFKGLRRGVAQRLLPHVRNGNWFFDTELLLLAERCGYRIAEVPVLSGSVSRKSRVRIVRTIMELMVGLIRVRFRLWLKDF